MKPFDSLSTQCQRILRYLAEYECIDPIRALTELGIMRLAARINDLEKAGYEFKHEMVDSVNRFGEKISYMEYRMVA